jgi:hypothetical protein
MRPLFTVSILLLTGLLRAAEAPERSLEMSESLRASLKTEAFTPVAQVKELPQAVREALRTLFQSQEYDWQTLRADNKGQIKAGRGDEGLVELAEPGEEWQSTDVRSSRVPWRRLVFSACSPEHCIVHYERGGMSHSLHIAIFRRSAGVAQFEWGGIPAIGVHVRDLATLRWVLTLRSGETPEK